MTGHDPQHTYRSSLRGPVHPRLVLLRRAFDARLVGPDGRMYGLRTDTRPVTAVMLDPKGRDQIAYHPSATPVGLRPDGNLLAMDPESTVLRAFSPSGGLQWSVESLGLLKIATPIVTADNELYAPFAGHPEDRSAGLDVFSPNGDRHRIEPGTSFLSVALAPDGTIYALNQIQDRMRVEALAAGGKKRWQHALLTSLTASAVCVCLAVDASGRAYVGDGSFLRAYDRSGQLRWRYKKADGIMAIAERGDGSILLAGRVGLTAVAPRGVKRWTARIQRSTAATGPRSLVVDAAGVAYVGTTDGYIHAIAPNGRQLWRLPAGGYQRFSSPTLMIDPTGRLIVNGNDGVLRVFGDTN